MRPLTLLINVLAVTSLMVATREHFLPSRLDIVEFNRETVYGATMLTS